MGITRFCLVTISCFFIAFIQVSHAASNLTTNSLRKVGQGAENLVSNTLSTLQNRLTQDLCNARTDELCEYYGYEAEVHNVTTHDGYILTVFRCYANSTSGSGGNNKKVLIKHHGILSTSDDFTLNIPSQSLAYVFADNDYDVWLPNNRGSFYSRQHVSKDPDDSDSGFWNFSWDDIGFHDYPAIYHYVRNYTGVSKFYIIAHSQGTSSLMALFSEKPEYNAYAQAVSLMTPVGYMGHAASLYQILGEVHELLQAIQHQEFLPRSNLNEALGTLCTGALSKVCNSLIDVVYGPSNDRNLSVVPIYLCHLPSGSSADEFIHFGDEIENGFFGRKRTGSEIPPNFPLNKITVPITLYRSPVDPFTASEDVDRLIVEFVSVRDLDVHLIDEIPFDHVDFMYGIHAAELVYSKILKYFKKHAFD